MYLIEYTGVELIYENKKIYSMSSIEFGVIITSFNWGLKVSYKYLSGWPELEAVSGGVNVSKNTWCLALKRIWYHLNLSQIVFRKHYKIFGTGRFSNTTCWCLFLLDSLLPCMLRVNVYYFALLRTTFIMAVI